jgi:hypothetical protein
MKAVVVALVFALSAAAQEQTPRSTERSRVGTGVQDPIVDYYDSMSDYFRNTSRAIMAINQKGIPDLEIPAVLLIARRSSASPNQIIEARKSGKSWDEIAKANKVSLPGKDFAKEANIVFLSDYHGRPAEQIRAMEAKGASFIAINQEFRREGQTGPRRTEQPAKP